jgi:hypothetical protein
MLYAVFVCSARDCDEAYEAWGEPSDLEALTCEVCDQPLEMVAFANADREGAAPRAAELRQRRAA